MAQLETALGCGTEAAVVAAKMAGFHQAGDARWYTALEGDCAFLNVPQALLSDHLKSVADAI
ncbi:hypothetical protein E2K80_04780 [Rhodophyticola sp. CCM32]|uniref:hypothetical protein n=1 Tax=Rhodophyticola sp. CCM32 TaxID=2916397 RepID=UPI00107FC317|nr:hypothetical protein [Rhodophyticola sp. CCM32]QBY00136.1 hypothetical protein E2K80_04780 [Rhodophyticola sp. CCM32]